MLGCSILKRTVFLFQKRKVDTVPSEEGGEKPGDDSPKGSTEDLEMKVEVRSNSAELEKKKEEKKEEEATQPKRKKAANPYGAWEQIKEEKDP